MFSYEFILIPKQNLKHKRVSVMLQFLECREHLFSYNIFASSHDHVISCIFQPSKVSRSGYIYSYNFCYSKLFMYIAIRQLINVYNWLCRSVCKELYSNRRTTGLISLTETIYSCINPNHS